MQALQTTTSNTDDVPREEIVSLRFIGISHLNIAVQEMAEAVNFYRRLLGARLLRSFPRFKNIGFAKSAGFLNAPELIEVSISFLEIPGANLVLELMQYHNPEVHRSISENNVYDVNGVKHVALKVADIDAAFQHVKAQPEIRFINDSECYIPFQIDEIEPREFELYGVLPEVEAVARLNICEIVSNIRYFYFVDPYGVQWEFEYGHADMGR